MKYDSLTKEVKRTEKNLVEVEFLFDLPCGLFEGHFPDLPLLPGVIQIDLAITTLQKELKIKKTFIGFENIKFFKPIFPNSKVRLITEFNPEKNKYIFQYSDENQVYSKGVVVVADE